MNTFPCDNCRVNINATHGKHIYTIKSSETYVTSCQASAFCSGLKRVASVVQCMWQRRHSAGKRRGLLHEHVMEEEHQYSLVYLHEICFLPRLCKKIYILQHPAGPTSSPAFFRSNSITCTDSPEDVLILGSLWQKLVIDTAGPNKGYRNK